MNTQKLAKLIKIIIKKELKEQLPVLITEYNKPLIAENRRLINKFTKRENDRVPDTDPFLLANKALVENRNTESKVMKRLSKNPILNEVLNNTSPFSSKNIEVSNDKSVGFDSNIAAGGVGALNSKMANKLGLQTADTTHHNGMGASTGVPMIDKILNRDYSELLAKSKK